MSDCVHSAFAAHANHLGVYTPSSLHYFHAAKQFVQRVDEYTWQGVVPWLVEYLGGYYGLRITAVQHSIWTVEHYLADAPNETAQVMTRLGKWGEYVKEITLQPAIYALYSKTHAVFSTSVPQGEWVNLAIQLERVPTFPGVLTGGI